MRKDKEYGSFLEINNLCEIIKIEIKIYIRYIDDEKYFKKDEDILDLSIEGRKYEGNFGLIFVRYKKDLEEIYNHFNDLLPKVLNLDIFDEKLENFRNTIINKYPNIKIDKIISGKTGKKVGPRQGKSDWKIFDILSRIKKEKKIVSYF